MSNLDCSETCQHIFFYLNSVFVSCCIIAMHIPTCQSISYVSHMCLICVLYVSRMCLICVSYVSLADRLVMVILLKAVMRCLSIIPSLSFYDPLTLEWQMVSFQYWCLLNDSLICDTGRPVCSNIRQTSNTLSFHDLGQFFAA